MRSRVLIVLLVALSVSLILGTLVACGGSSDAKENRRLGEQVATLTDANDTLAAEKADLQAQVETLAEQVAALPDTNDALATEKAELAAQVETLTEQVATLTDTNEALASQKVELDAQVETLAGQVASVTDANDMLTSENAELQGQVETLGGQVATLTGGNDALAAEIAGLQGQVETLAGEVAALTEQRDEASARAAPPDDPEPEEPTGNTGEALRPDPVTGDIAHWRFLGGETAEGEFSAYLLLSEGTATGGALVLACPASGGTDVAVGTDEYLLNDPGTDRITVHYRLEGGAPQSAEWESDETFDSILTASEPESFLRWLASSMTQSETVYFSVTDRYGDSYSGTFTLTGIHAVLEALPCFSTDE